MNVIIVKHCNDLRKTSRMNNLKNIHWSKCLEIVADVYSFGANV